MRRIAALVFAELTFLVVLVATAGLLPPRVASHFNLAGDPDGWMTRGAYLATIAVVAVLPALLMAGLAWLLPSVPNSLINLPHKEYWLSAERRAATLAHLQQRINSIPAMMVLFAIGLHLLIVQANRQVPARLSNTGIFVLAGLLIFGLGCVLAQLLRTSAACPKSAAAPGGAPRLKVMPTHWPDREVQRRRTSRRNGRVTGYTLTERYDRPNDS